MLRSEVTNTEILMFILGWQGGTIHQLTRVLNKHSDPEIKNMDILNANYEDMQTLMRRAQKIRNLYGIVRED